MDFYIDDGAYVVSEPTHNNVVTTKNLLRELYRIREELEKFTLVPKENSSVLKKDHDTKKNNARPVDLVKKVIFNERKGATTVLWNDGTVTVVKCSEEDEWDEEKGIAVCFMKKMYQNRGCFNEFLRKYLDNAKRL